MKTLKNDVHSVYTLPADGEPEPNEDSLKTYCQLIRDNLDHHSIVWIETPTYTHVDYLKELLDTPAELIVLEKPITANLAELTYNIQLASHMVGSPYTLSRCNEHLVNRQLLEQPYGKHDMIKTMKNDVTP